MKEIQNQLKSLANGKKAIILSRFFKTGPGQYGEGDMFLGITVPEQRIVAKKYRGTALSDVKKLLTSKIHEYRLTALLILVYKYDQADIKLKDEIYNFYLKHRKWVNNWDLVDLSAPRIVGDYLLRYPKKRPVLYSLVKSDNLWERRVSILTTLAFIKKSQFTDTLKIAKLLLTNRHDLIHKSVGWMLREMGKVDEPALISFLEKHSKKMPRTMLRYSLERLSDRQRKKYMTRS